MMNACLKCKYRGVAGSNTRHSRCNHPRVDYLMSDHNDLRRLLNGLVNEAKVPYLYDDLKVEFKVEAIAADYAFWPLNFDPVWLISCSGFKETDL